MKFHVEVNVNDYVWVRLTKDGEQMLVEECAKISTTTGMSITDDVFRRKVPGGWSQFLLWQLMNLFGPAIRNGSTGLPFENNTIRFTDPYQ